MATEAKCGDRGRLVIGWTTAAAATGDLARLAASFAGVDPREVRVVHACWSCGSDQHGRPHVLGLEATAPIHVSLSRAGQLAVLAVSDAGPVGIDVEAMNTAAGSPDVATWVRKESIVKATGHGLMVDPDLIDVTPPDVAPALLAWPVEPLVAPAWMFDVECPEGHVAAATVLSSAKPHLVIARVEPEG